MDDPGRKLSLTVVPPDIDVESGDKRRKDVDRGWAWIVLGATFTSFFTSCGLSYNIGIFFVSFLETFNESKSYTAWIGAVYSAIFQISGPISSLLLPYFGARKVLLFGAVSLSLCYALLYAANSVLYVMIVYGVFGGVGCLFVISGSVASIVQYFDRRLFLASGIMSAGGGLGIMVVGLFTEFLIESYGWRGCLLLLSGISLHICVCGALVYNNGRQLKRRAKKPNGEIQDGGDDKNGIKTIRYGDDDKMSDIKNGIKIIQDDGGDDKMGDAKDGIKNIQDDDGDAKIGIEIIQDGGNDDTCGEAKIGIKIFQDGDAKDGIKTIQAGDGDDTMSDAKIGIEIIQDGGDDDKCGEDKIGIKIFQDGGNDDKCGDAKDGIKILQDDDDGNDKMRGAKNGEKDKICDAKYGIKILQDDDGDDKMRGAKNSEKDKICDAKNNMKIIQDGSDDKQSDAKQGDKDKLCDAKNGIKTTKTSDKKKPDEKRCSNFFCDIRFWYLNFTIMSFNMATSSVYVFFKDILIEKGLGPSFKLFLTCIGIGSMIGRGAAGYLSNYIDPNLYYFICGIVSAVDIYAITMVQSEWAIVLVASLFGICHGGMAVLQTLQVAHVFGYDQMAIIWGYGMGFGSISVLIGPPLGGWIADVTGNYNVTILFFAIIIFVSGFFSFLLYIVQRNKKQEIKEEIYECTRF